MNKIKILWAVTLVVASSQLFSQDNYSIVAAGGSSEGMSYSIGQPFYEIYTYDKGTMTLGVQQVYEITTVSIKDIELDISVKLFPNPTSNQITIYIHDSFENPLMYKLYDAHGKILENAEFLGQNSQISLGAYSGGMYFLQIIDPKQRKLKSFRIIKNH